MFYNSVVSYDSVTALFIPPPQSAVYLAGTQCTVDDSLPAQGVHPGDERGRAAPTVLLPGEGTRLLQR